MDFSAYCLKLANISDYFDSICKNKTKIKQKRFQIINDAMQMNTVNKIQFGQLNDKRFYFPNGIVSLPFGHCLFDEMRKKKTQNRNIHLQIKDRKWEFIKKENEILNKNERLLIFCQIINGNPILYKLQTQTPTILPLTVSSYHVTYVFQSESTLYSCLNVKELLARSRREI